MNNKTVLFVCGLVFLLFGCRIDNCIKHYVFEVPLIITPEASTLHVGDTLSISMVTDNTAIYDTFGKRMVQFPDFDPNGYFRLPCIDTFPVKEGFLLNELIVDTIVYDSKVLYTQQLGLGLFFLDIQNNRFNSKIEFQIVLNTPGTYMLVCSSALFDSDNVNSREFPDRCGKDGDLEVYYSFLQGSHKELLNEDDIEILAEYWNDYSGYKYTAEKYYFKVLE